MSEYTNVVEEPSASMFRAATLQIKVAGSIETLVLVYNTMWFNFPEECILTHYLFGSNVTHLLLMFCVHTSGLHARKRYQNVCLSSRLQVNAAALNPEILESQKLRITVERKPSTGPVRFKTTNNHQETVWSDCFDRTSAAVNDT